MKEVNQKINDFESKIENIVKKPCTPTAMNVNSKNAVNFGKNEKKSRPFTPKNIKVNINLDKNKKESKNLNLVINSKEQFQDTMFFLKNDKSDDTGFFRKVTQMLINN